MKLPSEPQELCLLNPKSFGSVSTRGCSPTPARGPPGCLRHVVTHSSELSEKRLVNHRSGFVRVFDDESGFNYEAAPR